MNGHNVRRNQIICQGLRARTESEVSCAIQALDQWMEAHPNDATMRDAYGPLTLRQIAFHSVSSVILSDDKELVALTGN